jgi:hypothetical protein
MREAASGGAHATCRALGLHDYWWTTRTSIEKEENGAGVPGGSGKSSVGGVGAHAGSLRSKVEQSACALVVHILVFPFKLKKPN